MTSNGSGYLIVVRLLLPFTLQLESGMSNATGFAGGGVRRNNGEPSVGAAALWTSILWKRMEKLMDEMYNGCIKVETHDRPLDIWLALSINVKVH